MKDYSLSCVQGFLSHQRSLRRALLPEPTRERPPETLRHRLQGAASSQPSGTGPPRRLLSNQSSHRRALPPNPKGGAGGLEQPGNRQFRPKARAGPLQSGLMACLQFALQSESCRSVLLPEPTGEATRNCWYHSAAWEQTDSRPELSHCHQNTQPTDRELNTPRSNLHPNPMAHRHTR